MKLWKKLLLGLAVLLVAGVGVIVAKIGPRNVVGMIRYDQRRDGHLRVGDRAPDAMLVALDGQKRTSLLQGREKPLVVVFGSFT